jgi:hypothetical protein
MIAVEKLPTATQVTIPDEVMPPEKLEEWLDRLRIEAAAQRNRQAELEVERLAKEIKSAWWAANKHRFLPPDQA